MSNKTMYLIGTFALTFLTAGGAAVGAAITSAAPAGPSIWALALAVLSGLVAAATATQKLLEPPPA